MAHESPASKSEQPLLTKAAKLDKFAALFGGKLSHPGALFLPNCSFYNKLASDSGLSAAARELYKWLGVKPRHSAVAYGEASPDNTCVIPDQYRDLPYQAGALLALHVVRSATEQLGYTADDSFIEFTSLESGLGILVVNGLYPPHSAWEKLVHDLHGQWHANTTLITRSYHPNNYVSELLAFAESRQMSDRLWVGYLHTAAQRKVGVSVTPAHQEVLPAHESARRNRARTSVLRLVLLAILGGIIVMTGVYVTAQRPKRPSGQAIEQYEEVVLRKHAYEACANNVQKLTRHSESNDIFADQELNAEKSRCLSLQNNYNAAVSRYNATLAK